MGDSILNRILVLGEDLVLDKDYTFDFSTSQYKNVGIQIVWKNLTGTINSEVDFKVSIDREHFDEISSSVTLSGASGNDCIPLEYVFFPAMRVKINKNSVTGGTISIYAYFKE
jgi:hypothetical protein